MVVYDMPTPIVRTVQLTGGSTYTVSLPKDWATAREIENGTKVACFPSRDQLVIERAKELTVTEQIEFRATELSPPDLARCITAAYIAGTSELSITGIRTREQRNAIRDAVHGLVGIEIQEESETSITARTMLDSQALSPARTLRQIEKTALSMHEEAMEAIVSADAASAQHVIDRDDEVDRLFGVIAREFHRTLQHAGTARCDDGLTAFDYYTVARQLERIGDHAEGIAKQAARLDGPPTAEIATEFRTLGEQSRRIVRQSLAAFLNGRSIDSLLSGAGELEAVTEAVAQFDRQLFDTETADAYVSELPSIVSSVRRSME